MSAQRLQPSVWQRIREQLASRARKPFNTRTAPRLSGKSYTRREQMRRHKARHGRHQITIHQQVDSFIVHKGHRINAGVSVYSEYIRKPATEIAQYLSGLQASGYVLSEVDGNIRTYVYMGSYQ